MNIRRLNSGEYYVPRPLPHIVAAMDSRYVRVSDRTWRDPLEFEVTRDYTYFEKYMKDEAYIVGKGKSIDSLRSFHFKPGVPIFCANEAVLTIEEMGTNNPVIGLRQDGAGIRYCPQRAYMLPTANIANLYASYANTIILRPKDVDGKMCTVALAINVARNLGATKMTLYGMDAHTARDFSYCANKNRRNIGSDNLHLLKQRNDLRKQLKGVTALWLKPDLESFLMDI